MKQYLIIILLVLIASLCSAQSMYDNTEKLIHGTWRLDSMYIGGQQLPEAFIKKIYEQMQESKKYTTYYFAEDGRYSNATRTKNLEGEWKLSQYGDTLKLMLPDKIIINKILYIDNDSLVIEPQNETKEVKNSRIFMVRPKDDSTE